MPQPGELPKNAGEVCTDTVLDLRSTLPATICAKYRTLAELSCDYVLLNHGLLFTHGGFRYPEEDPLAEWCKQQVPAVNMLVCPLPRALFTGMDAKVHPHDITWNRSVIAVPREHAKSLLEVLAAVMAVDRTKRTFYRVGVALTELRDPTFLDDGMSLSSLVPMIKVVVIALDGNFERLAFDLTLGTDQLLDLWHYTPRPETIALANSVLGENLAAVGHEPNSENSLLLPGVQHYFDVKAAGPRIELKKP